jgi:methanogenic corrinoid protein MtbC1
LQPEYLDFLLNNDSRNAVKLIQKAFSEGVSVEEIYLDILQEVMNEVGNMWHQNVISVDMEHYCTSATQLVLSNFYQFIFSQPRNGRRILTCCVGSELHEMGIRMVSDLFEYNGWDSIYLGAAVPNSAVLNAIKNHKPDLIGLSITMPQHLPLCLDLINEIRKSGLNVRIAVGGRALETTNKLWEKWDIDVYTVSAVDLVNWADNNILIKKMEDM